MMIYEKKMINFDHPMNLYSRPQNQWQQLSGIGLDVKIIINDMEGGGSDPNISEGTT